MKKPYFGVGRSTWVNFKVKVFQFIVNSKPF